MAPGKILRSPKIMLPFLVMLAVLTIAMPRSGEFEYHYRKGGKWNYETLVAPFSFPILKTSEQIRLEKERLGSTYVPYYKYEPTVYEQLAENIDHLIGEEYPAISKNACLHLHNYYNRGVLPDFHSATGSDADENQEVVYIQKDKRAAKSPKEELYTMSDVKYGLLTALESEFPDENVDSILAKNSIYNLIVSNLEFDRQTTDMVQEASAEFISPTSGSFPAGDIIVSTGEIITSDIAQILDSYKAEFEDTVGYNGPNYLLWLGNFGIALILSVLVFSLLFFMYENSFSHPNEFLFIIMVFVLACAATFVASKFPINYVYLIPYPVFALFYTGFFRKRLILPLYVLCLVPLLVFVQGGAQYFITFLFSGFIGVFAFQKFNKSWKQFISALIIFVATFFCNMVFRMFNGTTMMLNFTEVGYMALGSLFCVAVYPLVYLFEIVFNLMSANRLVELTDTSRTLLRELADKTPGTFQHSLAVMNMADAAARAVDANVPLIRAAALYHDIGKIMNPMCFIENQAPGVKYHDLLGPKESAQDIIRHVQDGEAMADKYGVPSILKEFITTHHGTTTTGYFWAKYINEGGDPAMEADFTYPGPKPKTKEQAIIMLCDTLEAASRTLDDFSAETVNAFVDNIYNGKFKAGQFDDADITLHDLSVIKDTLKNYIVQVHHGRIAYPPKKNN